MTHTTPVTYLFDPLCGWCYGASPMVEALMGRDGIAVELVPTGLFAGDGAFPMNDGFARHAWDSDQRIAALSGQPFTEAYRVGVLGRRDGRVDSGPTTLALTAVRLTAPEREFETLKALQSARYAGGRDNGDPAVVAAVLDGLGLDEAAHRFRAPDAELLAVNHARMEAGRADMRRFGANGVPALIAGAGESRRLLRAQALFGGIDTLLAHVRAAHPA